MPPERFVDADVSRLLERVRRRLGPDAELHGLRRLPREHGGGFEILAAAPGAAPPVIAHDPALRAMRPALGPRVAGRAPALAVVGPTGAGKTSTLARLAAHPDVFGGLDVAFLSLDGFRVGGAEALREWARAAGAPFALAHDRATLERALARFARADVVLVDTPGRGPVQRDDVREVGALLRAIAPREVHLVLPAGLDPAHARLVARRHLSLAPTHLLATKLDECPGDRALARLARELELPARWATLGPGVPADLRPAAAAAAAARSLAEEVGA